MFKEIKGLLFLTFILLFFFIISKHYISDDYKKKYFRITVKGGGCSGFKYQFSFDDKVNSNDFLLNNAIHVHVHLKDYL